MSHSIPSATSLMFWRAHFILAIGANVLATGWDFLGPATHGELVPALDISPFDVALIALGVMLMVGPFVAEWGYITQRRISSPGFWRALFVVCAVLVAASVLMQIAIDVFVGARAFDSAAIVDGVLGILALGQLWAVWLYAWRSDHLWRSAGNAIAT